jgi:hypothetical protein
VGIIKFIKLLTLRWYGHIERINKKIPKQIVTTRLEGVRRRIPWKRWTVQVEEDLKIMGIGNWNTLARDGRIGGGLY